MKLFDVVRLVVDLPDENLFAGMIGTVIHIFTQPTTAYEIEFCDEDGVTVAQIALTPEQFELIDWQ